MKQKILAMSLPILLLTGVGCSNSEKENKPASAEQQEKKSFILILAHSSEDLESIMKDLKNLYKQDSTLKSVKESYIISLDKMKDILSKIYELDVDQKFKEHEEELAEAIRAYYQSIQYQKEVAQKDTEPNALDGKIKLEQSEDKFIEVVNKMIDIENGEAPEKKLEVKETNKPKLEDLPIEPAKPAYTENYMGKFGLAMKQLLPELQKLIAVGGNENLPSSDRAMKIIENEATLKGIANELRSYNPSE
ncbi:hypothetical protein [Bacillus thuringiensis]|uniref:hypothetical protein n=1 Tax=Bacillus thuringiensis TaxID=1428 RepID=UPI001F1F59D9|nr:hypothetical protein [Bacillus thuringiensis]